jgi:glucose-1-phosphate adenylyltransferase
MVILAGDHIYKMDYELMLRQHVDTGADVTVGCLEVPRMEATGFGVMHVDEHDRIIAFVEKPADPPASRASPTSRSPRWASTSSNTRFLMERAAPRRGRPRLEPRLRQGHHPLHRQARQGGGAPLHRVLRALEPRGGRLLARRRHGRRLLGGQHRPHRRVPELDLYDATGRSGPMPRSRRRPSSCTTTTAGAAWRSLAGLGRLHRLGRRLLKRSLLFTGVRVHSYSELDEAVVLPDAPSAAARG